MQTILIPKEEYLTEEQIKINSLICKRCSNKINEKIGHCTNPKCYKLDMDLKLKNKFIKKMNEDKGVITEFFVPKHYENASLEDYDSNFKEQFYNKKVSTPGYFIFGNTGTGKSHLSAALLRNELYNRNNISNKYVRWYNSMDILMSIKDCFRKGGSEKKIISDIIDTEFIVIDDIGSNSSSEWCDSTICYIIDKRIQNNNITIITSNYGLQDINKYDNRLASRLSLFKIIYLDGHDLRTDNLNVIKLSISPKRI